MIAYNPKDWFSFIFRFHKADTFRKLFPALVAMAVYSGAVAFVELEYWKVSDQSHLKNISIMHNLLGVVISLLLVFRTNTAYERWWEGRKLWGELVNASRSFAVKIAAFVPVEKEKTFFNGMITLYARVLRSHLQDEEPDVRTMGEHGIKAEFIKHAPNQVALAVTKQINRLYRSGKLTGDQLILLNSELQAFTGICGGCERIKNTPIPYSYSAFIKKFIFFYAISMPFGYAFTLGYLTIPVVVFIFYILASLELIAEEIEDPFGRDPNDLPLTRIITTIQSSVAEILER